MLWKGILSLAINSYNLTLGFCHHSLHLVPDKSSLSKKSAVIEI